MYVPRDIRQLMPLWSRRLGGVSIVVGSMVLLGWLLDIPTLKSLHPDLVTMKANTALCFLSGGVSLYLWHGSDASLRQQRAASWCAQALVLVGGLTLAEYLLGRDFGIDQLLFREAEGAVATSSPGRMAPNTALSFILLGLALTNLTRSRQEDQLPRYSQELALAALVIALIALFGYAYGVHTLYGFASYTRMAVHTMGAFLVLASGVLIAVPNQGLMAVVTAPGSGGQLARRLLPAALAIPAIVGWLFMEGARKGAYDMAFALTLVVVSNILVFSVLIWWNSRSVEQVDRERQQTEERFRNAIEAAPNGIFIVDRNGRIILVNARAEQMFGYPRTELLGQSIEMLVPERFRARHSSYLTSYFHNPSTRPIGTGRDLFGKCRDEREFPVDIGLSPIHSDEGDFVLTTVIDISARKETEDALRQARDQLEVRVEERTRDLATANDAAQAEIIERKRVEQQLIQLMTEVQKTVDILAASASEIVASTTQVASSSAETATAVSQTMATVEEVKQTSQLAAEKARQVSESAQRTVEISKSGRKSVDESVESMHRIQEQMESIAESIVRL
ncbi:PAS domain S-box protein, partial [Denitratisoma oestradiolicum]